MKKTLFLSAILGAALCSSAFGTEYSYTGTNNTKITLNGKTDQDTITFKMGSSGTTNWFDSAQSTAAKILIEDDETTTEVVEGLNINNGNQSYVTFSGTVTGAGAIQKTGAGTNLNMNFTGDVTGYTGNITLNASNAFVLRFGATTSDADDAGTAPITSSATAGVSGTGDITFKSGNNTLVYNYAGSENPVYITNAIKKNGGTANVQLLGGASYVLTKASTIDSLTFANNSSLKYTGSEQTTIGGQVAAGSVLEGVITNNASNLKYTGTYGANSGTLKNVSVADLDAGATNGSITLDGVYGWLKSGGTQRNITLTGNGLHLTAGYSNASFGFQKIDGSGNLVKQSTCTNETFTFSDATEWTGNFVNQSGTSNLVFNGNSKASIEGRNTLNVTLKGTDYSQMLIKAYNGKTTTVTVNNSADTTLKQFIQDPWAETAGHAALVLNNGHKTTISDWATVDSVTMKNNSSLQLNNHNIGTITVESGKSTVTSGAAIGSGNHLVGSIIVNEGADLTVTGGNNNATLTNMTLNSGSTVTLGSEEDHDHTLTLQNLTVTGGENASAAAINANLALSGGTLTMGNSVEMGCSVTLNNEALVLTNGVVTDGVLQMYTLFTGVDSLTLGTGTTPITEMGWYDVPTTVINSITVGTGDDAITITPDNCVIGYWNGTVTISDKSVPEPATATLSLLALAGLCARRRRK